MKTSKRLPITCGIVLVIFAFFLTSKTWLTTNKDLLEPTKIGEELSRGDTTFTMQRWDYDASRNEMEIEVGLSSTQMGEAEYTFEGRTRNQGKVDIECIASNDELIVLRVKTLPEGWKEVSISASDNEGEVGKLRTNFKKVHHAKIIDAEPDEYLVSYYQSKIGENEKAISQNQQLIKENEKSIDDARAKIEAIRDKMQYMTDTEKVSAENNISNIESVIKTTQEDNEKIAAENKELKEQNEKNNQRIIDIQSGNYNSGKEEEK